MSLSPSWMPTVAVNKVSLTRRSPKRLTARQLARLVESNRPCRACDGYRQLLILREQQQAALQQVVADYERRNVVGKTRWSSEPFGTLP